MLKSELLALIASSGKGVKLFVLFVLKAYIASNQKSICNLVEQRLSIKFWKHYVFDCLRVPQSECQISVVECFSVYREFSR